MNKQKTKAFTLVELIVVITILAILGTIAFISLSGYTKSSRDSTRISDLKSAAKTLELYELTNNTYPDPSDYTTVTYSGATVWYQGTIGSSVIRDLRRLSNIPLDPLTSTEYSYSINSAKNKFQIATALEGGPIAFNVVDSSYANQDTDGTAFIQGNYQGIVTNALTGSTTYVLTLPSIIASDLSSTDLIDIISNERLVYNGSNNLPSSYSGSVFKVNGGFSFSPNKLVAYSGSISELQDTQSKRLTFIQNVQDSYSGTTVKIDSNLRSITQADLSDTLQADTLAIAIIGGGALPSSSSSSSGGSSSSPTITFTNTAGANYTCVSCD